MGNDDVQLIIKICEAFVALIECNHSTEYILNA